MSCKNKFTRQIFREKLIAFLTTKVVIVIDYVVRITQVSDQGHDGPIVYNVNQKSSAEEASLCRKGLTNVYKDLPGIDAVSSNITMFF